MTYRDEVKAISLEDALASFYSNLLAQQRRLDEESERVLFDNLWELYEQS